MGNAQARQRLRGSDFHYLSKFTAFANNEVRKYGEADSINTQLLKQCHD
jgi:hypothetical protein